MFLKPIKALLLAAVLIVPAFTGWLARELATPVEGGSASVILDFEKGRSARGVVDDLRRHGLVRSALPIRLACRLFYPGEQFKAGEYEFSPPLTPKDILFQIFRGRIHLLPITIPEGLAGRDIGELLRPGDEEGQAAFRLALLDVNLIADLDSRAKDLEGYLFPNTYLLPRKATETELVAAMVAEFRKVFDEGRRLRAAELGLSVRDIVTLASLIEEETALPEERPLVSAVFHNRLRIGMKLDCDPTVIYALKLENKYAGRLLLRDLKFPSPYNTYIHPGLPPGPISNPGKPAIDAALNPAAEKYLYFVLQGDGSHRFSRTMGEHLDAIRNYRELKKK
ncbi:MAG: endolytic transglycosylase MltG [Candidatus Aminicenantes bacterium]|nr:endolytic transglycosylase MltG [Candidatus Aminicenantes bacterium]